VIVLVTGHPRSGTTCLARVVNALGIPVYTSHVESKNMEDYTLSKLIEAGEWDTVETIVKDRRENNWCFKRPFLLRHIEKRWDLFPGIRVIQTYRDPVAILASVQRHQGARADDENPLLTVMKAVLGEFNYAERCDVPLLRVSYEACITRSAAAVKEIAEFLDVPFLSAAVDEVVPADPRYLPNPLATLQIPETITPKES
jgi:hypothetical protein